MVDEDKNSKESFLYPIAKYRGDFTPQNLVLNANIQEFGQRVALICGLEANGKISPVEAYNKIKDLWEKLDKSKQELLDS
ncbi:MAG: hypothetical protein DSM107014_12285 [Gomphosphaeria aponina SAG 52.96 = DSM 107014]|uniref:Uncharacterized protein n=1 Tax=Gomphosphaeria aponina SAG 52.96 = DSM 107014 TaxID=1521640 RepID=A0A941JSN0_9CHRO|nr:hypothetical protein [Gomphosphaeria aponina SAG 52.96 = DSM 107014]